MFVATQEVHTVNASLGYLISNLGADVANMYDVAKRDASACSADWTADGSPARRL